MDQNHSLLSTTRPHRSFHGSLPDASYALDQSTSSTSTPANHITPTHSIPWMLFILLHVQAQSNQIYSLYPSIFNLVPPFSLSPPLLTHTSSLSYVICPNHYSTPSLDLYALLFSLPHLSLTLPFLTRSTFLQKNITLKHFNSDIHLL